MSYVFAQFTFEDLMRTADVCVVLVWPGRKNECGRQLKALLTHVVARKQAVATTHGYISDAITTNVLVLLVSDDVPQVAVPREDGIQKRPFLCLLCG